MSRRRRECEVKRLSEIEARLKAATPGPWEVASNEIAGGLCIYRVGTNPATEFSIADFVSRKDGDLIANAPTDLALLVRLVRMVADNYCIGHGVDEVLIPAEERFRHCTAAWCWPCRLWKEMEG